METMGARIKARRIYLRMNQSDVAQSLGMSRPAYGHYETGHSRISVADLPRLASILDVSVNWLLGEEDDAPAPTSPGEATEKLLRAADQLAAQAARIQAGVDPSRSGLRPEEADLLRELATAFDKAATESDRERLGRALADLLRQTGREG